MPKLIDLKTIEEEYGLKRSTVTKLMMKKEFIAPVKIGNKNYFKRDEVEQWIDAQQVGGRA